MGLEFDHEAGAMWTYCDNTCGNKATVLAVETDALAASYGSFVIRAAFDHPSSLPNINNEGIAISECSSDQKSFFWSDDSATDGHSIRLGSIPCGSLF